MSELFILIPAAGESRRYKEAGYSLPKPTLWIENGDGVRASMLGHVEATLPPGTVMVGLSAGVALPEDCFGNVVRINKTIGQADTIYQMLRGVSENARVLVVDCDMILGRKTLEELVALLNTFDVTIAVTYTFDPNASRVDKIPFPTKFVEKEPISAWGIVGARAFGNAGMLRDALAITVAAAGQNNEEPYLSTAINDYPGVKFAIETNFYVDWGTPERLQETDAKIIT